MNARDRVDSELFIHRPTLQAGHGKLVFRILTAIAWALYLYLWLPLATLALWWGGAHLGLHELRRYPQYVDLDLFVVVAKAFAVALVLLLGWAEYNRRRFQGVDRRQPQPALDPAETAQAMACSPALARQLRLSRRAIVRLDEEAIVQGLQAAVALDDPNDDTAMPPHRQSTLPTG